MPLLSPEDRKRLLGPVGTCARCREPEIREYCRSCDEFYCRCQCAPRSAHEGHRVHAWPFDERYCSGDPVLLIWEGRELEGHVLLASTEGRALIVVTEDGIVDGFVGLSGVPISREEDGRWRTLTGGLVSLRYRDV